MTCLSCVGHQSCVELTWHAATAKTTQRSHQSGQGQFARAGERVGEFRVPGLNRKDRALDVLGQSGQNQLYEITVLMQNSYWHHQKNKQNIDLDIRSAFIRFLARFLPVTAMHDKLTELILDRLAQRLETQQKAEQKK